MKNQARKFSTDNCYHQKMKPYLLGLLSCLLLLGLTSCTKSTHVSTNAAGHQITAEIVGSHSIDSHPDRGTISSPFGKITIEPTRVKFDEESWNAIAEGVPIEVRISRGKLWLAAGSLSMKRTIR